MKLGRLLVEMADRIIGSGGAKARPADFLNRVLSEAGVKAFSDPLGAVRFPAPEVIWQAWKRPGSKQWDYIKRYVEVIAGPKEVLERPLVTGDILVRIALGEPGLGHLALIADPQLWRREELAGAGLIPEGSRPGRYVQVVEGGVRPHRLWEGFARRLGKENGQLSHESLILRIVGVDRPAAEGRTVAFEYATEDLGAVTQDFSLREIADGTLGKLPDDILAAILTNGESDANDLTNRVFWQNHPDLKDQKLDPKAKDRKTQALREEWVRILRRQVKPIIWLRQVIDELDQHRGDIPREFLLGWIAAESDGKVATISSLGERGYYQIMWKGGEAKAQLGLTEAEFRRLRTDREFSMEQGIRLAEIYRSIS